MKTLVVTILIIALISALGFLFYQIMSSQKTNETNTLLIVPHSSSGNGKVLGGVISISSSAVSGSGNSTVDDITPPRIVTDLSVKDKGTNFIYWTWTNPTDSDFDHSIIYINGVNVANTNNNFYNATSLLPSTAYTIIIHTVDTSDNVNLIDISNTAVTNAAQNSTDTTPPATIQNLSATDIKNDSITWSWLNPTDSDFAYNIVYLDGVNVVNSTSTTLTALNLLSNTTHTIIVHTIDTSGNVNTTDVSSTVTTLANNSGVNQVPVANNLVVSTNVNTPLNISLLCTDADGDALTYIVAGAIPGGAPTHGVVSGTAPNVTYTPNAGYRGHDSFLYQCDDGKVGGLSNSATVSITVGTNTAPIANAGVDQNVNETALVTLNGTASSDADGDALTYSWTQTAGPAVVLSNSSSASPTFTAPHVSATTPLTFSLVVSDGIANSTADTVTINVNDVPISWLPLSNQNVNEDLKDNTNAPARASRVAYANITSRVIDVDGTPAITVVSTHSHYTLSIVGNDLVISNIVPNWYGAENVMLSANGVTTSFVLTVNHLLDDCISIPGYGGTYTVCD